MTFSILASQLKRLCVVQEKIGPAWFAIGKLRPIFISKISDANKMRLFKATVEIIAAYGLESVPMTRSLCRQIEASHRQLVRAALGITWPDNMSTAELTQRAKLIPLSRTIRKRQLRLVGHSAHYWQLYLRIATSGKVMVELQRFSIMLLMISDQSTVMWLLFLGWQSRVSLTWSTC